MSGEKSKSKAMIGGNKAVLHHDWSVFTFTALRDKTTTESNEETGAKKLLLYSFASSRPMLESRISCNLVLQKSQGPEMSNCFKILFVVVVVVDF